MLERLHELGRRLAQAARLMVGQPDYDNYAAHMKHRHPELPIMSREEFFRERQNARYEGKSRTGGCC